MNRSHIFKTIKELRPRSVFRLGIYIFLICLLYVLVHSGWLNDYYDFTNSDMTFYIPSNFLPSIRENYVNIRREKPGFQHNSTITFTWLHNNPVYARFRIKEPVKRKRVTILVIVSSGPRRVDRRQAIRETWWKQCKTKKEVVPECIFMTDHQGPTDKYYNITQKESVEYGDIRFQHVEGGITFGFRFLNHMLYAVSHYQFDYFLRVDDDYFLCFENFLHEIPRTIVTNFHWGWVHCFPRVTRPEESMILLSYDIIERFLKQDPNKILCHPWADQMIGTWSNVLDMKHLFRHDERLHHTPIVDKAPWLRNERNVCSTYMGIHGCYPKDMKLFWSHRGPFKEPIRDLVDNSRKCIVRVAFSPQLMSYKWNYDAKPCISNPVWDTSKQFVKGGSYVGRQENVNGSYS